MPYTRRTFLETAGALAAAAGLVPSVDLLAQSPTRTHASGAPGVELPADAAGLPDYSHECDGARAA